MSITEHASLELRDVAKKYGSVEAVAGVGLVVRAGEFLTVLGPSGSGKTTILKMIAGFEAPTSGEILLGDRDISRLPASKREIGMVFQNYALFPHLSAAGNIAYGLKVRRWPADRRRSRIDEMLDLVGLGGMGGRLPRELSGGQQQRVALARALAFHPRLLLMDEPLGALDRELRIRMAGEIRRIHQETGTTVVYVTHDREEALTLSDRIAIMLRGRLDSIDTPERLYRKPATSFAASFFGGHNVVPARYLGPVKAGRVSVEALGTKLDVPAPDTEPGSPIQLSMPARAFDLATGGRASATTEVEIARVVYMGDTTRASVIAGDDVSLQVELAGHRLNELAIGHKASLTIDTDACVIVAGADAKLA